MYKEIMLIPTKAVSVEALLLQCGKDLYNFLPQLGAVLRDAFS